MNESLKKKVDIFTDNNGFFLTKYKVQAGDISVLMSFLFTVEGMRPDGEELDKAEKILKEKTGLFSITRGVLKGVVLAKAVLSGEPAKYFDDLEMIYEKIRNGRIFESENELLAAMVLLDYEGHLDADAMVKKIAEILKEMNDDHPILTDRDDTASAATLALAFPERPASDIANEIDACYRILKKSIGGMASNEIQTVAAILTAVKGDVEKKCEKALEIIEGLQEKKMLSVFSHALPYAGALSALKKPAAGIVEDVEEIFGYLEGKAGFKGLRAGIDTRLIYAASFELMENLKDSDYLGSFAQVDLAAIFVTQITVAAMSVAVASSSVM